MRKKPGQARSIERVELILETARELIGTQGNDAVSMREIASQAGLPISSLYQYFPDKSSLLISIMDEYYELIHESLRREMATVKDTKTLIAAIGRAMQQYAELFQKDPALANIWSGVQADPRLTRQDLEDTYRNMELYVETVMGAIPGLRRNEIKPVALFFIHSLGGLVRFSLVVDESDSQSIMGEMKTLVAMRIESLAAKATRRKG